MNSAAFGPFSTSKLEYQKKYCINTSKVNSNNYNKTPRHEHVGINFQAPNHPFATTNIKSYPSGDKEDLNHKENTTLKIITISTTTTTIA